MVKRGRGRGRGKRVEGESGSSSEKVKLIPVPVADQTPLRTTRRLTRATHASLSPAPLLPLTCPAASDASPSLARYKTCNSLTSLLGRCNATRKTLRPPTRFIKAKLEDESVPTIPGVFAVETQNLRQQYETLPSLPEVAVENNAPPSTIDVVLNTEAAGQETRSAQSGARPTKSGSLNLTRIVALTSDNHSDDEVESRLDPGSVSISGYRVKEKAAPVLQRIFNKYGNIAEQCSFTSVISSSLLEDVCDIYMMLEGKDLKKITTNELESMLKAVEDLESAKVDVGWLRQRLNDIFEAKQLVRDYGRMKEAKSRNLEVMETNKKLLGELEDELASCIATRRALEEKLAACTAACDVLEGKICETKLKLDSGNREIKRIVERYEDTNCKVKSFLVGSLVHDLL